MLHLKKENQTLSGNIFTLTNENGSLVKQIAKLNEDIKYLSQKGVEMAKTLM